MSLFSLTINLSKLFFVKEFYKTEKCDVSLFEMRVEVFGEDL
jgi:hypothetical protein